MKEFDDPNDELEDPNDELEDPNDELEDGNDFADLKEGAEEKDGGDEKEFEFEVKVLVEGEEGEAGLPMMVWKWEGWRPFSADLLTILSVGVPE